MDASTLNAYSDAVTALNNAKAEEHEYKKAKESFERRYAVRIERRQAAEKALADITAKLTTPAKKTA